MTYPREEPESDHSEIGRPSLRIAKLIPAGDMIHKSRNKSETSAADQQMTGGALIRTDAKTAAFALIEHKEHTNMKPKNTICLWFDKGRA